MYLLYIFPLSSKHLQLRCSDFFNRSQRNSFGCAANRRTRNRKSQRLIDTSMYIYFIIIEELRWLLWCPLINQGSTFCTICITSYNPNRGNTGMGSILSTSVFLSPACSVPYVVQCIQKHWPIVPLLTTVTRITIGSGFFSFLGGRTEQCTGTGVLADTTCLLISP
jgi:hypothetical protein